MWNIINDKFYINEYIRHSPVIHIHNDIYKRYKNGDKFNIASRFKSTRDKNNYTILEKFSQKGSLILHRGSDRDEFILEDDQINSFLLMNNLQYYFEQIIRSQRNETINILLDVDINVTYNNINNHKYMDIIDICLPTYFMLRNSNTINNNNINNNFSIKSLVLNEQLKLNKNTKNKIIKIIYVYQYLLQNYHHNIIYGIISKIM